MKLFSLFVAAFSALCMLASSPVHAAKLTLLNGSSYELSYIYIETESADLGKYRTGVSAGTLPQCSFTYGDDAPQKVTSILLDAGVVTYKFENLSLDGGAFKVVEHEDKVLLAPEGMDDETAIKAALGGGSSESVEPETIDVDAGPIWDNDHAKETCPAIAEAWMEENPGMEAEWTGHWNTPEDSDTSVCNLRVKPAAGSDSGSSGGGDSGVVLGTVTKTLGDTAKTTFEKVIAVKTADEAKALGAVDSPRGKLMLTTELGGVRWVAYFNASNFDGSVSGIQLYALIEKETEISATMKALSAMGYRPWFAQVTEGEEQETAEMVRFWANEEYSAKDKAEAVLDKVMNEDIYPSTKPVAINAIFLQDESWGKAAAGGEVSSPCLDLRVSPAMNLTLVYRPDASGIVTLTRMAQ